MPLLHWCSRTSLVSHWEDVADWLNRFLSVLIVLVLGICAMAYVYIVRPITCYLPDTINSVNQKYVTDTCWSHFMVAEKYEYSLYETVRSFPFLVFISVLGFYAPHALWQHVVEVLIDSTVKMLMKRLDIALDKIDSSSLDNATTEIANHLVQTISVTRLTTTGTKQTMVKTRTVTELSFTTQLKQSKMRIGIPCLRFLLKTLYVVNIILQFFFTLRVHAKDSHQFTSFRHLGACELSSLQAPTVVQCTLTGNLFLREIFSVFNTWLIFVMIVTVSVLLLWLVYIIFCSCRRVAWIKQRLLLVHACQPTVQETTPCSQCRLADSDDESVHKFVSLLTQTDAVAVLELIDRRAGSDTVDQILLKCWHLYVKSIQSRTGTSKHDTEELRRLVVDDSTA